MYKSLTCSRIPVELASPAYLDLGIIQIIILSCRNAGRAPVYAWNPHPRLLGVRNYFNNYFAMYKRLTYSRIRVKLASHAYLDLGIIQIIILSCRNV